MSAHDEKESAKKKYPQFAPQVEAVFNAIAGVTEDSSLARAKATAPVVLASATAENFDAGFDAILDQIHVIAKWIRKGVK